jgi:hypothetical protein
MDGGQDRALLNQWVGQKVYLQYMGTENPEVKVIEELADNPGAMSSTSLPQVRTTYLWLERYDRFGIEVRDHPDPEAEDAYRFFVSWGAVLTILGPQEREEVGPEPAAQERAEQLEGERTEEAAPAHDRRQELMDRLANAQTTTEVAVARGAADAWLAANPSDGDVRMALDRLPDPTGD